MAMAKIVSGHTPCWQRRASSLSRSQSPFRSAQAHSQRGANEQNPDPHRKRPYSWNRARERRVPTETGSVQ
jgi:hypothetical protein